jgi:hypothetical protein
MRRNSLGAWLMGLLVFVNFHAADAAEPKRNGFVLEPASIPVAEILGGGPPRDGIPALVRPKTVSAAVASWRDDDLVLGVTLGGETRAYPVAILNWHELVNDTLGGQPILVSFCPLCNTGIVFDRRIDALVRKSDGGRESCLAVTAFIQSSRHRASRALPSC